MTDTPKQEPLKVNGTVLTTQQALVYTYLSKGRTLTNKVALTCLGVGSLSSRISELRRIGVAIETDNEEDTLTGRLFKKYNLAATTKGYTFDHVA